MGIRSIFHWNTGSIKGGVPSGRKNKRYGQYTYLIQHDGTAAITGYQGEQEDLTIPGKIGNHPVTTIAAGAFALEKGNEELPGIYVTLPNTLTTIGEKAFANRPIFSINIPESVEHIGYGAFLGNDEITFRISNRQPYFATVHGALYSKQGKELLQWTKSNGEALIPEGILSIGDYAFAQLRLQEDKPLLLPKSLRRIGAFAFWSCKYANTLTLPSGVNDIAAYAFADADMRVSLGHCEGLNSIAERAFARTNDDKFKGMSPAIVDATKSVRTIASYAFYRCDKMPESALANLLTNAHEIAPHAFSEINCKLNLDGENRGVTEAIHVSGTCRIVGECAFYNNTVHEITIGEGVEKIAASAFLCCGYAGPIYLPRTLKYIAQDAFDRHVSYLVEAGSYAETWVRENACAYTVKGEEENLDWLK